MTYCNVVNQTIDLITKKYQPSILLFIFKLLILIFFPFTFGETSHLIGADTGQTVKCNTFEMFSIDDGCHFFKVRFTVSLLNIAADTIANTPDTKQTEQAAQ